MRSRGFRRALALVIMILAVATGCGGPETPAVSASDPLLGPADPATGSPVRIGLFNLEGVPAADFRSVGDSAVAAAAYANDHLGGLDGHPIEIVRCADTVDPVAAAACADEFVRDRVVAVVAGQPSTSDAVLPKMLDAGIPWVGSSPVSQSEIGSSDAFFFSGGLVGALAAWAQYSHDLGYRDVVIYGVESAQVAALVEGIGRPMFTKAGVAMRLVSVPVGVADSTAEVKDGLADKPDAVIVLAERTVCQSVMAALHSAGATQPRLVSSACVDRAVIDALGEQVIDNVVVFGVGDPSGTHQEAQVYRAVMHQYAPAAEPTGLTTTGYVSMLGFIRAVNAAGLPDGDQVTGKQITAALRAARDVPRPLGNSGTFSCDRSQLHTPMVQATICTSEVLYTIYTGGVPGRFNKIDVAPIFDS